MADFTKPDVEGDYTNILSQIRDNMSAVAAMENNGEAGTQAGYRRWSDTNNRFEKFNGSGWVEFATTYNINVSLLGGQGASFYRNASNLNAGTVSAARLPAASTSGAGIAQLNSATSSTSTTQAATPSAVNSVRQMIPGAGSVSVAGFVQLSSSVTSTSNTLAATSGALKVVYDLAYTKASISQMAAYDGNITGYRFHSNYVRMNDNVSFRLGSGDDFRLWDSGAATFFRSYRHGGTVYLQGEDNAGTVRNAIVYDPDAGTLLYYAGSLKLQTRSDGAEIDGRLYTDYMTIYNSDQRLKTNERELNGKKSAEILDALRWVLFDWIEKGAEKDVPGVIAQEVKKIYPAAVYERGNGYYGVSYDKLFILQMNAAQWERERVRALFNRVKTLEAA